MNYLALSTDELTQHNAFWTAKEISQQPEMWQQTAQIVTQARARIDAFLAPLLALPNLQIIFTGAGTSAFAGRALQPFLINRLQAHVCAVATTELVSNPYHYFQADTPTLLVSFARSGNSPESVGAVELANQFVKNCYHLVITCNAEGALYRNGEKSERTFALALPPETNDRSFAMTSSFSCMTLAACLIFLPEQFHAAKIHALCTACQALVTNQSEALQQLAKQPIERLVYLGSGGLKGLAEEAALKILELTAGRTVALFDSPLGFRHGPKSVVNEKTLVLLFLSSNPYTRQYDLDLAREIARDGKAKLVIFSPEIAADKRLENADYLSFQACALSDIELIFPYIIQAQMLAFYRSFYLGNTPDNPCPTGEVNRVVQGVTLYPF